MGKVRGEGPLGCVMGDRLVARAAEDYVGLVMSGADDPSRNGPSDPIERARALAASPTIERAVLVSAMRRAWRRAWMASGFSREVSEAFAARLAARTDDVGVRLALAAILRRHRDDTGAFTS